MGDGSWRGGTSCSGVSQRLLRRRARLWSRVVAARGRGRRGGSVAFLVPPFLVVTQSSSRSSSTLAVAFSRLVLLVPFRAVFFPVAVRPRMLCIMAGMDPKDCIAFFAVSSWVYSDRAVDSRPALRVAGFTGDDTSRAVFLGNCAVVSCHGWCLLDS